MKRTCYGCRALDSSAVLSGFSCALEYDHDSTWSGWVRTNPYPKEECPKPKTWKRFMECIAERDAKREAARKA